MSGSLGLGLGLGLADTIPAVVASAPANTVAPVASGTLQVGQTLSCTDGTWTGSPSPTFTYQWQRDGVDIGGETNATYVVALADIGKTIRRNVTGTNSEGSATASSNGLAVPNTPYAITAKTVGWWTADAGVTSSGGLVSSWVDRIASIDLTQSTDANKPSYSATGWNTAQPGLTFDGARGLSSANVPASFPTGANASEIWAVFDCTSTAADGDITRDMVSYGGTSNGTYRSLLRASASSVNRLRARDGSVTSSNTAVDIAGRHYGRGSWTGSSQDVYPDGGAATSAALTPATGTTRIRVGNTPAILTTGFEGVLRDVFVLNAVPSAGEITALNAYCAGRV